jgi:hypothetical protein
MTTTRALERHGLRTLFCMALLIVVALLAWLASALAEPQARIYGPDGRSTGIAVPSSDGSIRYFDSRRRRRRDHRARGGRR